jgi:biopolymer transport protein ExbD
MAFGTQDEPDEVMNEINMTPLVDVMLVLLIIFIITVPVMKHAVNIDLPRATSEPEQPKPQNILFSVTADGAYYWNEEKIDDSVLPSPPRRRSRQGAAARVAHPRRQGRALRARGQGHVRSTRSRRAQDRLHHGTRREVT